MTDRLRILGNEQKISRRNFLRGSIAAVALAVTAHELIGGVSFNKPPLGLRPVTVGRAIDDIQPLTYHDSGPDSEWVMTMTDEGRLIFEPSEGPSLAGTELEYSHRANSEKAIIEAYEMGANYFDIDANDVGGTVFAEHGIIPQVKVGIGRFAVQVTLPVVVDVNEYELKLGMPEYRYEDLVECVASLNTPEKPLAISTEFKRGDFEPQTVNKIFDIHQRHKVPVVIQPSNPHQFDFIGSEIAQLHSAL